jgi:hypothetical protein
MEIDNDDQLIPNVEGAEMLGVTPRTKHEWEKCDPNFPPTYWFNGRKYNKRGELRAYMERRRAAPETKKNPGWEVTRTRPRAIRDNGKRTGRFSADSKSEGEIA